MSLHNSIRQSHRWLSVAFTAGFVINAIVAAMAIEPPFWVYLLALGPLFCCCRPGSTCSRCPICGGGLS